MRKPFSTAVAAIVLLTASAEAHHMNTLGALRMAIQNRNFRQMKALYSAGAYEGKKGSIALKSLEKWIEEAENVRFEHGANGDMPALKQNQGGDGDLFHQFQSQSRPPPLGLHLV